MATAPAPLPPDGCTQVQARVLFYGGVNNVNDAPPQQYLTGNFYRDGLYDTLGRTYYLGVVYDLRSSADLFGRFG